MAMLRLLGLAAGMAVCLAQSAAAQADYPNRPITMVVPLPAGGTADVLCRLAAERAGAILGKQIITENRAGGAGGRIGTEAVLRAQPDGYTLLCAPQLTYSITHLLFAKSSFDARVLEPVSVLAGYPLVLVVRADLPVKNTAELVAYGKANPGKLTYGHQGKGNTGHLLGELMAVRGGFKMTEVPYRGSAPAINDLLSGNIDMVPDYLFANKQNIDAGKLKLIGTAGAERLKDYPDVGTVSEALPGVTADTWMAISAPPGTTKDITKKLSDAIGRAIHSPELRKRILGLEAEPLGTTPDQMRAMIKKSTDTWAPVIQAAKITVE